MEEIKQYEKVWLYQGVNQRAKFGQTVISDERGGH